MEKICPICNGLYELEEYCPKCGNKMKTAGAIQDFYGPYSPYMGKEFYQDLPDYRCIHLIHCSNCGYDKRIEVSMVEM
ncbi:MAG: hypothetical protein PHP06_01135 [Clostridia bacterium]|nr:hypothetical protein [Clostridia bacterium]